MFFIVFYSNAFYKNSKESFSGGQNTFLLLKVENHVPEDCPFRFFQTEIPRQRPLIPRGNRRIVSSR